MGQGVCQWKDTICFPVANSCEQHGKTDSLNVFMYVCVSVCVFCVYLGTM